MRGPRCLLEVIVAEELIAFASKQDMLAKSKQFWNPDKTQFWIDSGVPLVIDRREGYFIYDVEGKRLIDVHLNGGTYNLGHRNPEVVAAVTAAMQRFDIGNHHFPSLARTALAEALVGTAPEGIAKVIYGSGGSEANDIALKSARHATKKRGIVSVIKAYHGHTGLAVATGDERFTTLFLADRPDEFTHVPFNDLDAMEAALRGRDVAAVIMETIPATYGFPLPAPGYLSEVKRLCERYGALYIADEVQTGLMRTGELWAISKHGVAPDILVSGKGISGGMYPISVVLATENASGWLTEDGFGHISSFGGAELGCVAALKTLEITCQARGQVDGALHLRRIHHGAWAYPGAVPGLVHRHPAGRAGHGAGVRPPTGRQVRHETAVRERGVGDLFHPRPQRAAVQARHPAHPGALRGTAGTDRGGHRQGPRRRSREAAMTTMRPDGSRGSGVNDFPRGAGDPGGRRPGSPH